MKAITVIRRIDKLTNQLIKIQDTCPHPSEKLEIKHKSNTGNYDPTSDVYWTEFKCGTCFKFWTEDSK